VVKEFTKCFKETNVNIMKAILALFVAVTQYHKSKDVILDEAVVFPCAEASIQKIADKKLSDSSKAALTGFCTVSPPVSIILNCSTSLKNIKSPVAHEEFLRWCQSFLNDFGGFAIVSRISDLIPFFVEVSTTNIKDIVTLRCSSFPFSTGILFN
jgi:hypothetical protein